MFIIFAGSIYAGSSYAAKNSTGLISFVNVSFAETVIPNTNPIVFILFFVMIGFALVSFFAWASKENVIEEDDYLTKIDEFEFYRPNRDF